MVTPKGAVCSCFASIKLGSPLGKGSSKISRGWGEELINQYQQHADDKLKMQIVDTTTCKQDT